MTAKSFVTNTSKANQRLALRTIKRNSAELSPSLTLSRATLLIFVFVAIWGLVAISCASDVNRPNGPGLEGTVLRGPTCPVETENDPCPDEPFSALFHVFNLDEEEVATFTTSADGTFRITLAPGDYLIVPDQTAPIIHPSTQAKSVTVVAEKFTEVTLVFDTGIQ